MEDIIVVAPTFIEKNAILLIVAVIIFLGLIHWHILSHIRLYKPDMFIKSLYTPFLSLKYAYEEMDRTEAIVAIICTFSAIIVIVMLLFANGRYREFIDMTSRN